MEKKENQRTRLTKKMLKDALIDILQTSNFQSLTITEICNKAEINRTTFYKYYSNERSLYDEIESDFLNMLRSNLENTNERSLEMLLTHIAENAKVAGVLFNNSVDGNFAQRVFSLPEVANNMNFKRITNDPNKNKLMSFIFNGGYAIIKEWINSGLPDPPKELARFISTMVEKLLK